VLVAVIETSRVIRRTRSITLHAAIEAFPTVFCIAAMNTMAFTTLAPMLPAKTAFRHVPIASFYRWITLRIEAFMIGTITRIVVRGRIIATGDGTSDTTICAEFV
jgi:hypothetical protein